MRQLTAATINRVPLNRATPHRAGSRPGARVVIILISFEFLSETHATTVDHMDELTYIRGRRRRGRAAVFPVETWNQHATGSDGIARSTNSVEGWHHGLQSLFQCHYPTVWTFISGIQRDIQRQKALFLRATTGVSHPSAKKYRALNDRVARAVGAYGRAEVLVYLRLIAYLSDA